MQRIVKGRGTGKTHDLMLYAKDNNAIFVCSNPYAMKEKSLAYGITGIDFMDYSSYLKMKEQGVYKNVVIDEIETFLNYVTGGDSLIGYTLSLED